MVHFLLDGMEIHLTVIGDFLFVRMSIEMHLAFMAYFLPARVKIHLAFMGQFLLTRAALVGPSSPSPNRP